MTVRPDLSGITVVLFGNRDALDHAVSDELARRGCNTHHVSVTTGWLKTVTHAVLRIDTPAGAAALDQLAEIDQPLSHVIAVCAEQAAAEDTARLDDMCRACGTHHEVSLIWHPPLHALPAQIDPPYPAASVLAVNALAAAIADEMAQHAGPENGPSFASRPFTIG